MKDWLITLIARLAKPAPALGGALVIGVLIVGYTYYTTAVAPSGATARVTQGPLTEEVDLAGTVKAAHATDLAFQIPGRVASVRVSVGDHVAAGTVLLALDGGSQAAALAGAKAALEIQQAKLASLQSGTRPEQLTIDETAVTQAGNSLSDALGNAYSAADDAVHVKADQVFTNPRSSSAMLAFTIPDAALVSKIQNERILLEPVFTSWQSTLAGKDLATQGALVSGYLAQVATFLNDLAMALAETPAGGSLTAATLSGYQTSVNAARGEISGALTGVLPVLTASLTNYKGAEGALALAQAGATSEDLAAQQAAVDAAAASVQAAQVLAEETVLVAPVSGTVSAQNAELGESVSPAVPLVSLISDGKYQATARVSDTDIAKLSLGQVVDVSFDSFPGVSFPAKVTTVDPAATTEGGVSSYGVTVTFDENDPRLSPGLSANLRIITGSVEDVLQVPSSAIIRDGEQSFVYLKTASGVVKTPVETGAVGASGMTQITSGLSAGDTVLTYGASA